MNEFTYAELIAAAPLAGIRVDSIMLAPTQYDIHLYDPGTGKMLRGSTVYLPDPDSGAQAREASERGLVAALEEILGEYTQPVYAAARSRAGG